MDGVDRGYHGNIRSSPTQSYIPLENTMEEVETRFEVRLIQLAEQVDRLTKEQEALKAQLAEIKGSGLSATIPAQLDLLSHDIPLESSAGGSYARLKYLLKCRRWKEADEETSVQLSQVIPKVERQQLSQVLPEVGRQIIQESVKKTPWEDLNIIDSLWLKYSYGKFGLSIQSFFYRGLGGNDKQQNNVWKEFEEIVGWRKDGQSIPYGELFFDHPEKAVRGQLPYLPGFDSNKKKALFSRKEWIDYYDYVNILREVDLLAYKPNIRSSALYQEELTRELEEERATLIDAFFKEKFTEIDEELLAIKPKMIALPKDKFADALLKLGQWSREQLLEHWQT